MIRFSIAVVLSTLVILNCGLGGESKAVKKRNSIQIIPASDLYSYICSDPAVARYFGMCATTPVTPAVTATTPVGPVSSTTTVVPPESSTTEVISDTTSATNLQLAHWCQFNNGSYLSYGYTFMYTACAICQCTQTRAIRCTNLQCMPTYCIDGSSPTTRTGQCCSQCAYEQPATTCTDNGVTFPQGTLIKTSSSGVQCWCQAGGIECRQTSSASSSSMGMWGDNSASYIVIIVLCIVLILGSMLCCGCTLFYYYYYQRHQQSAQLAYDQYWNNAGWQPMGEEELGVDPNAEQKRAEAEQGQVEQGYPAGNDQEYIPPPYALYNGSYLTEGSQQKHA